MATITLTTDFGNDSWFVGTMKGVIASICPHATVIDLNHGVAPFDIHAGAFSLLASYRYFPDTTVHVVVIDPGVGSVRRPIVVTADKYSFIAPDNGVLTPIVSHNKTTVYHATNTDLFLNPISNTFHGRDIFAPLAAHLASGIPASTSGPQIDNPVTIDDLQIIFSVSTPDTKGQMLATIMYVDRFGNLITNVPGDLITDSVSVTLDQPPFHITGLRNSFDAVAPGNPLLIAGSSGFLELAVNQGNAAERFRLTRGDTITITNQP